VNGSLGFDVQKMSAFILQLIQKNKRDIHNEEVMGLLNIEFHLIKPLTYFIGWLPEYVCWLKQVFTYYNIIYLLVYGSLFVITMKVKTRCYKCAENGFHKLTDGCHILFMSLVIHILLLN